MIPVNSDSDSFDSRFFTPGAQQWSWWSCGISIAVIKLASDRVHLSAFDEATLNWTLIHVALLFFLYAEIHYRFKLTPSLLYRRHPEIIADAPHRLDPGHPLPILILVKDAHRFPIELLTVDVRIIPKTLPHEERHPSESSIHAKNLRIQPFNSVERIQSQFWWRVFWIDIAEEWCGMVRVDVEIRYRRGRKEHRVHNDNYAGTSHAPLEVYLSPTPLPTLPGYVHGDLHCHTDATSDQVEFGAPVEALVAIAKSQGLVFVATADHSYDLDDFPDDYLHNDPGLCKWHRLQERIRQLNNCHSNFVVIPGEEVSCGNALRRNVHFLILNHSGFIHGRGDSAERWLRTSPDHSITEVLDLLDPQALAFAAHPAVPTPTLERLLLGRGNWQLEDLQNPRLNGLQFWNGTKKGEEQGYQYWRQLLLQGKKLHVIAGSDAHGNFNRFRQISFPFVKLAEHRYHLLGLARTVAKVQGTFTFASLLEALQRGRACITTGPVIDMEIKTESGEAFQVGETAGPLAGEVCLRAASSAEFGKLESVTVWRGRPNEPPEQEFFHTVKFAETYDFCATIPLQERTGNCYLRAQVVTAGNSWLPDLGRPCTALTNPIWID